MTVSELIRLLSALEKHEQDIYARGNNCFIVPINSIQEFSADNVTGYVITDGEDISKGKAADDFLKYCSYK